MIIIIYVRRTILHKYNHLRFVNLIIVRIIYKTVRKTHISYITDDAITIETNHHHMLC